MVQTCHSSESRALLGVFSFFFLRNRQCTNMLRAGVEMVKSKKEPMQCITFFFLKERSLRSEKGQDAQLTEVDFHILLSVLKH